MSLLSRVQANAALSAERESTKGSVSHLHAQISSLQSELAKANALVDNLKSAKRVLEVAQSDFESKLRRAESSLVDANEKADFHAEQAVLLKQDLEDHVAMHAEYEARTRTELKEMKDELMHAKRQAEQALATHAASSNGPTANGTSHAAANGIADSDGDIAGLQEEIQLLQEEKQQLNQDIEEVTTDLTRVQEENEELTAQVEQLQAQLAAGGGGGGDVAPVAVSVSPATSLPADLERISLLQGQIDELEAAAAAAKQAQQQANEEVASARAQLEAATSTHTIALASQQQSTAAERSALQSELAAARTTAAAALDAKQSELDAMRALQTHGAADADAKVASLAKQLAESEARVTSLGEEVAAEKQQAATVAEKSATRTRELEQQLEQTEARLDTLSRSVDSGDAAATAQVNALREEVSSSKKALQVSQEHLADAESAAAERVKRIARLEQDAAAAQASVKASLEKETSMNKQIDDLKVQLAAAAVASQAASEARSNADADNQGQAARAAQLEADLVSVRAELATLTAESAARVQSLESQVSESRTARTQSTETFDKQLADLAEQARRTEDAHKEKIAALTAAHAVEIESLRAASATLTSSSASADVASSELTTTVATLKREKSALQSEVADLSSQASQYADQYLQWAAEKEALQQQLDLRLQEIASLQQALSNQTINQTVNVTDLNTTAAGTDLLNSLSPMLPPDTQPPSVSNSPLSSAAYAGFGSPAPPLSLIATVSDRELAEPAHVAAVQSALQKDLAGLQAEVTRLDTPAVSALQPALETLQTDVASSLTLLQTLQANLASSTDRELDLMDRLQQMKGTNIRVFARVRPMLPHELADVGAREENLLQFPNEQQISIRADAGKRSRALSGASRNNNEDDAEQTPATYTPYTFDKVFLPESTQEEVYESVEDMILPVLGGYRGCIFTYGQTGSGSGTDIASSASVIMPCADG